MAEITVDHDPDQLLAHSLWCDMQDEPPAVVTEAVDQDAPTRATDLLDRDLLREGFDYAHGLNLIAVLFRNLIRPYEVFHRTSEVLSDAAPEDQFWAPANRGVHSGGGRVINAEQNRLACLRNICAMESAKRTPSSEAERDAALVLRLRHELLCEMKIHDRSLLTEIHDAWAVD